MGRLRYIEPEFWENGDLDRLGFLGREVFLYLFSVAADDEGRFKCEPYSIWRHAVPRSEDATGEDVAAMMDALANLGMILRYAEGQVGFLTGWFAHQYVRIDLRKPSALPRPPVEVGAWSDADLVRAAYTECLRLKVEPGKKVDPKQASYKDGLRWFSGLSARERRAILRTEKRRVRNSSVTEQLLNSSLSATESVTEKGCGLGSREVEEEVRQEDGLPLPTLRTTQLLRRLCGVSGGFETELGGWVSPGCYGVRAVEEAAEKTVANFDGKPRVGERRVWQYMLSVLQGMRREQEQRDRDNGRIPDWPEDTLNITPLQTDLIRQIARSPHWREFPEPLVLHFESCVYDAIMAERAAFEAAEK